MLSLRIFVFILVLVSASWSATFGTVVPLVGGAADILLDEPRGRLYLVNAGANRLEIYSIPQRRFLTPIALDSLPLSAAMSLDQKTLYVACHNAASLNLVDLDGLAVSKKVTLPARPEGIAVGGDDRVLLTTIGTGAGNSQNILLLYDPNADGSANAITNVVFTPPAPQSPILPPTSGRLFLANRSQLAASRDGRYIIGVNIPNNTQRAVFVYEVASSTVLRSRVVNNVSSVLAVSADGSKFMAGLSLFLTDTLEVIAQQNLANAPYPIPPNTQFNTQSNQGGSVFTLDGITLYSAFDVAPYTNPPTRANVSQLMLNDPDNLLIKMGIQLPENMAGKMVVTSDGGTLYAISESGFTIIPIAQLYDQPVVDIDTPAIVLASDQCGVTANQQSATLTVKNMGKGRITTSAQVLQYANAGGAGLGGFGGPGGGAPGGGIIIILPGPGGGNGGTQNLPGFGNVPGQAGGQAVTQTAPTVRTRNTPDGPTLQFSFNALNSRTLGTTTPVHDFLIQSDEAVNIPPRVRVFQNTRNAEARADVATVPIGITATEGLVDMVLDSARRKIYIANSGMNRVEVFDIGSRQFQTPIKVGQLPRSLALTPDNSTLYVANTGGESISIVDLGVGAVVDRVKFPPLPFNAASALVTPSVIAASQRGLQIVMNNGTLWKVIGNEAFPRDLSPTIGSITLTSPRTMVSTPNGESILVLAGNGFLYQYDALADDFVQGRQVFTAPIQGYFGPVAAGPRGQYYAVNGLVLNQAFTPTQSAGVVVVPGRGTTTTTPRPVSAVAPISNTQFARFVQPIRLAQGTAVNPGQVPGQGGPGGAPTPVFVNPLVSDLPAVEIVDVNTGNVVNRIEAVEGPLSAAVGAGRTNVDGRLMTVDPQSNTAYLLTTSGLSIVPLAPVSLQDRPTFATTNPVLSMGNQSPNIAIGGLFSMYGRALASDGTTASGAPLPTILGGSCVTLGTRPLPLVATASGQINAQIPPDVTAGRYTVTVRNIDKKVASTGLSFSVVKYSPAIMTDPNTKQAAIYFASDGTVVSKDNPATRDQRLIIYAIGLGPTKGAKIVAGQPTPADPPATTDTVQVFIGDPRYKQAEMIVENSILVPGLIGVYQVNIYVPGAHMNGDALPVTLKVGGVSSPATGNNVPTVALN